MTTVTPTAIDGFVHVEFVRVVGRHRYALGKLDDLAASIEDIGLLNPLTLTRDGRLIAGHRRLEACRRLGWQEVPVRFIDSLDDATRLLRAERDENTCRKEMLPSELASLGAALYAVEARTAKERQGTRTDLGKQLSGTRTRKLEDDEVPAKTSDIVGPALGMSGRTYQELKYVYDAATDPAAPEPERVLARAALDQMDRGAGIAGEARRLRVKLNAKRDAQEAKAVATVPVKDEPRTDPDWIPASQDRSPKASARRRELIRDLGGRGLSSMQIGQRLGINDHTIRAIAREEGMTIQADEAMGARTRKSIDSNRIVRETVQTVEALGPGIKLVDFEELDQAEIANWTASLTASIRVLNRLNKRLKEKAQ